MGPYNNSRQLEGRICRTTENTSVQKLMLDYAKVIQCQISNLFCSLGYIHGNKLDLIVRDCGSGSCFQI